ncbi:hypothetical protein [Croceitalea rosinachiae]|uniref:Uncharacterized protein n=1 Tax=Croceitalea rosinachiae TaxID=3075596 RepID=A0ABU3ABR4_9FLAO|nr:hypothetical protein [Croceitalea sp. F388]MDT0607609.1 hypothetical protein [Croceitalea sp. F388]
MHLPPLSKRVASALSFDSQVTFPMKFLMPKIKKAEPGWKSGTPLPYF